VFLDVPDLDWDEIRALLWDAWKMSAPKRLLSENLAPPKGW
jgi:hypothetical protein